MNQGEPKRYTVKAKPGARVNRVELLDAATLSVSVTEPPVAGRANRAIIELLAEHFNVPKTAVQIVRGWTSRNKVIEIN